MKANMGTIDRAIRIAVVVLIVMLYAFGYVSGALTVVLGIVAAAFLLTSAIGWCPSLRPVRSFHPLAEARGSH